MTASLDIVIPVLNEEYRLVSSINKLHSFATSHLSQFEWNILIADNGSTDSTKQFCIDLSSELPNVGYIYLKQRGRGRALKKAWLGSEADIVCYMDVDLSTDLAALPHLVSVLETGEYDLCIGSRLSSESTVIGRKLTREMISRILDLPDKVAREIMIPRTDMVRIDATTLADEVLQIAIQSRHSRIPVYQGRVDHIIGILHVKELLDCWAEKKPIELEKLVASRPPFFTPESRKIWDLFQDLQANKQHLAIVVDEYGGTAGIVTLEDIIEEIVGEIQDEYDTDDEVERIQFSEQTYSVEIRTHIDDFNDIFQTEFKAESVDTNGDIMIDHFFVHLGLKISILDADDQWVYRLCVHKP